MGCKCTKSTETSNLNLQENLDSPKMENKKVNEEKEIIQPIVSVLFLFKFYLKDAK
jgi:hypothetical protein